jgi:hypothetical protein
MVHSRGGAGGDMVHLASRRDRADRPAWRKIRDKPYFFCFFFIHRTMATSSPGGPISNIRSGPPRGARLTYRR